MQLLPWASSPDSPASPSHTPLSPLLQAHGSGLVLAVPHVDSKLSQNVPLSLHRLVYSGVINPVSLAEYRRRLYGACPPPGSLTSTDFEPLQPLGARSNQGCGHPGAL